MQLSTNSPLYQKAFEQYLRKGTSIEVSIKRMLKAETATNHHTPRYMWLTSGDEKVRPSHAANDGKIFYWSDPLPTGHPGEDFNCRCVAVPYVDLQDAALLAVGSMIAITPLNRARVLASRVLREGIRRALRREEAPPEQRPTRSIEESHVDILKPNGQPIGRAGRRPEYRELSGGERAARELYRKLSKDGVPDTPVKYARSGGVGTRLPNGDWVGYRASSKSGMPSIDLEVKGISFTKIKFPQ